MLERGVASLSVKLDIPMSSFWKAYFTIEADGVNDNEDFFYKPMTAAQNRVKAQQAMAKDFEYWDADFVLNVQDHIHTITYSIPLIASSGEVFGVLGVDIAHSYVASLLQYEELTEDGTGVYAVGLMQGDTFTPLFANSSAYADYFENDVSLSLTAIKDNIYEITSSHADAVPLWGSIQNISVYSNASPYEENNWVLMGATPKSKVMEFSQSLIQLLLWLTIVVIFVGILIAIVTSEIFTEPISRLVQELRKSNPNSKIRLKKTGIVEIDKLAQSIENLSDSVVESASKISQIVALTGTSFAVFEMDREKNLVFCSAGLLELLGWTDVTLQNSCMAVSEFEKKLDSLSAYYYNYTENIYRLPCKERGFRWLRINTSRTGENYIGTVSDISREMREKLKMEYDSNYDSLTDVMNQRAFKANMEELFEKPQQLGCACMLMWDLDNLKYVNDNFGHDYGDKYICALANCLKEFVYYNGFVCRRSGDEFLTFLYGYRDETELQAIIDSVWQHISQTTVALPDYTNLKVRVSAGVAWYPKDTQNLADLQRYADFAMYDGKHHKKGILTHFNRALYEDNSLLINGAEKLNQLIEEKLVQFVMQPIVSVKDASIYGYEMLMRSQLPEFKSPLDILRIARTQSKLYQIERLAWFESLRTFIQRTQDKENAHTLKIFINSIANESFSKQDFEALESEFAAYLPQVVMELTESEPLNANLTKSKRSFIRKYKGLIALDDYGSGYNSESTLLFIAPNIIKLDMSLVHFVNRDSRKQTLVANIVSYAKSRGIDVLAEGVENALEMQMLVELGVDYLQGYYIGKPMAEPTVLSAHVEEEIVYAYTQQMLQAESKV